VNTTELVVVEIHGLAAGGDGVGKDPSGRTTFVAVTAPGDRVSARVLESHPRWARAEVDVIDVRSAGRVEPRCALFAERRCGGCDWAHLDDDTQRAGKHAILAGALRRLTTAGVAVAPLATPESSWHWRRRARFTIAGGRLGFFAPKSHDVTDVETCPQLTSELAAAYAAIRAVRSTLTIGDGEIHIAAGAGGAHVVITARCRAAVATALVGQGGIVGVVWPSGSAGAATVEIEPGLWLRGDEFAQAGAAGNTALRAAVIRAAAVTPGDRVLELYAGNGNFTRDLIAAGAVVLATDLVAPHTSAAPTAQFRPGPAATVLATLVAKRQPWNTIVLDPPRAGAKDIVDQLPATGATRIVYISCDPATFARDSDRLVAAGFAVEHLAGFDLMPQTAHVELVATFTRAHA
jgi:23S rRNA (uracil1939-C5)-methyltransferase